MPPGVFNSSTVRPLFPHVGKSKWIFSAQQHFDRHHLVEHLDTALHLRGLRRLIAEPIDEHLDARDFLVLLAFRLSSASILA
jgi:hypothetical protein